MAKLTISLLGPFKSKLDEEVLTSFVSDKVRALLAYLVMEGERPHRRSYLAGMFWADQPQQKAYQSLRMALSNLRKVLVDGGNSNPFLFVTRDSIQFNQESEYWLDVDVFVKLLERALTPLAGGRYPRRFHIKKLCDALSLYEGHFLDQFFLKDSAAFEEWASLRRETLTQRMIVALDLMVNYHEDRGEYALARSYAERLVALMPWEEIAHRTLMRNLALEGQWIAAISQYHACQRALKAELDVLPGSETDELLTEILEAERTQAALVRRDPEIVHNLPPPPTHFVGRENELDELVASLLTPRKTLVTLNGQGGIGKTHLALEAGRMLTGMFPGGVFFVPLAAVLSADHILTSIADALGFVFQGSGDPLRQLVNYLRGKDALIILDNCEHLLPKTDRGQPGLDQVITSIITGAPDVKILATSRERLKLRAEWPITLRGLPYPHSLDWLVMDGAAISESYSSIQLFEKVASQVSTGFQLESSVQAVSRICQLMEGLPLGIELAATWVRYQSCESIAAQLDSDIDALNAPARDMPARHRSLKAVFNHSWNMLSQDECQVLKHLSLFQGGFDLEAASHVSGATHKALASLVDKSMIRMTDLDRYNMHALIQQFAVERLGQDAQEETEARKRYAEYFGELVNLQAEELRGSEHPRAFKLLRADIDNIRSAWGWAVENRDGAILARTCRGLHQFYDMRSWYQDGVNLFQQAAEAISPNNEVMSECPADMDAIAARLRMCQGWFLYSLGRESGARVVLNRCMATLRFFEDHEGLAASLLVLGHMSVGEMDARKAYYQESLEISRAAQNPARMIESLNAIGVVTRLEGDFDRARKALSEGLDLCQRHGDRWGESKILNNLGFLAREMGCYQESRNYHQQSLAIKQVFHDRSGEAMCFSNLGLTALRFGDLEEARTFFQESISIYNDIGNVGSMIFGLDNLGKIAFAEGDLKRALRLHHDVIRIAKGHDVDLMRVRYAFINLGVVLRETEEYHQAWAAFRQALIFARQGGYIPQSLEILTHVAELIRSEQTDRAVELLQVVCSHPWTAVQVRKTAGQLLESLNGQVLGESQPQSLESIIESTLTWVDAIWP